MRHTSRTLACMDAGGGAAPGRPRASSAACSRRRSATSGRLFQTRLYRLRPVGVPSRRIPDILSIAATGLLPSRRIPDFLSIAATSLLPSRRIQDVLSINEGRDKSWKD